MANRKSLALHVNLKPSRDLFDLVISYAPKPLSTVSDLYSYADDDRLDVGFDSPMTRAEIVHVKETNTACVVLNSSSPDLTFLALIADIHFSEPRHTRCHVPTGPLLLRPRSRSLRPLVST